MPPLTHSVASPSFASRFCISWSSVVVMRTPVQPIGWPNAIAPPLTFKRSASKPSSRSHAITCAAKASLSSIKSISESVEPLSFKQCANSRHWTNAHDLRCDAADLVIDNSRLRRGAESFQSLFTQNDHGCGAVSDAG